MKSIPHKIFSNSPLIIMLALFFLFGFNTVMNDVLMPHVQNLFKLSFFQSNFIQSAFFIAFLVCGLPAGWIISKIGYKKGIMLALGVLTLGLILFILTPEFGTFNMVLVALFIMGCGITIAQVAANPYIISLGTPETGSYRLNLAGIFNSFARIINTIIGGTLMLLPPDSTVTEKFEVMRGPYFIMAALVLIFAAIIGISKLPEIHYDTEQEVATRDIKSIWHFKHLILGAGAIFFYVGAEVAIGGVLMDYLHQPKIGGYTHEEAHWLVTIYWMLMMIGRFLGFLTLQKVRADRGLLFVSIMAVYFVFVGMFTSGYVSMSAIIMLGLCNSIMWPCIFPISLSKLGKYTSLGSGLLITMVVGGALIPLLQAYLAENVLGYNLSFVVMLVCYIYVLYFALVGNKWATKYVA
jgi:FHS family L-fucose permease-like MFS transporter